MDEYFAVLKTVDTTITINNIRSGISRGVLVIEILPLTIHEIIQSPKRSNVVTIRKISLGVS